LEGQGVSLQCHPQPDGWLYLVIVAYRLSDHFVPATSDLLIKVPPTYPFARPDMFWLDGGVRLADGRMPVNTSHEVALGRTWLRFSWHPTAWRQGVDSLSTFLAFINRRLVTGG
jgi:hypothetical protein